MIPELFLLLALNLWVHKVEAFIVICAMALGPGIVRRRGTENRRPFLRAAGQDLSKALTVLHHTFFAAMIVIASACGFVAGVWGAWVPMIVTALAVWATFGTLRMLFEKNETPERPYGLTQAALAESDIKGGGARRSRL